MEISNLMQNYLEQSYENKLEIINLPSVSSNYARNIGFKISKGDYVTFLDDDDELTADRLEGNWNRSMTTLHLSIRTIS
ncbi:MAG: glycosyltransferase [Candidatus Cloacimonetes bacterium]|nr:glycosyltransferase [Candidatus Cloacimonadota bacterium]